MDRYWFFTWRTYGSWLPGEEGFVGYYRNAEGERVIDNVPTLSPTGEIPPLARYARGAMQVEPVLLTTQQAEVLLPQFQETACYRHWQIDAVAILPNHVHIVFGVSGDPDAESLLRDWKSYASRALNRLGPRREAGHWWAAGGSTHPVKTPEHRRAAIAYVRDQASPLLIWLSTEARIILGEPAA